MRQLVAPGRSLDVATISEIAALLEAREESRQDDARLLRTSENVKTDAGGNSLVTDIYAVPPGFELGLRRWSVPNVDGSTPGTPFVAANGWIDLLIDEQRVEWIRLANGIPAAVSWSEDQGPVARNGQRISVQINGGPVSSNLEFRIQGPLTRIEQPTRVRIDQPG